MPTLKVLVNNKGQVVGTARLDIVQSGKDAPQSISLVARPGQQVVEMDIDEKTIYLEPKAFHAEVQKKYNRLYKRSTGKQAQKKSGE